MFEAAKEPEGLARLFVERANAGDVEGLVALYEPSAILACGGGKSAIGSDQIRQFYAALLSSRPQFAPGLQAPALRNGDIALTSSRLANRDVTAEIARRQADSSWLWIVDQSATGLRSPAASARRARIGRRDPRAGGPIRPTGKPNDG